jgi:hypothetical protein
MGSPSLPALLGVLARRGERRYRFGGGASVSSSQARVLGVALRFGELAAGVGAGACGGAGGGVGPAAGAGV